MAKILNICRRRKKNLYKGLLNEYPYPPLNETLFVRVFETETKAREHKMGIN
jgi:hypothetical protein